MGGKSGGSQPDYSGGGGSTWNNPPPLMNAPTGGPPGGQARYMPGERGMYNAWQAQERATEAWRDPQAGMDWTDPNVSQGYTRTPPGAAPQPQDFSTYRAMQPQGGGGDWAGGPGRLPGAGGGKFAQPPDPFRGGNTGVNGGNNPWPTTPAGSDGYSQGEPPTMPEEQASVGTGDEDIRSRLSNRMNTARIGALRGG